MTRIELANLRDKLLKQDNLSAQEKEYLFAHFAEAIRTAAV